jgi:hypothetical protein
VRGQRLEEGVEIVALKPPLLTIVEGTNGSDSLLKFVIFSPS